MSEKLTIDELIRKHKWEIQLTEESLGLDFPIVENGKRLTIAISKEIIKEVESLLEYKPQLNENQQKWFDRLSSNYSWHENVIEHALYTTLTENDLPVLSRKEFSEVIINFAVMVLKGEAE